MLKEISYRFYIFFLNREKRLHQHHSKSRREEKEDARVNAVLFFSLCLFVNILSLICAAELFLNIEILGFLPELSRYRLSSWILVALLMSPFIWFVHHRYFTASALKYLLKEYKNKSKKRLIYGKIFTVVYLVLTWTFFFAAAVCRNS